MKYAIFCGDRTGKYWLRDLICDNAGMHPVFTTDMRYVMVFKDFDTARKWRDKLVQLSYAPHIDTWHGGRMAWA